MVRNRKKATGMVDALDTLELSHESDLSQESLTEIESVIALHVLCRSKQEIWRASAARYGYWPQLFKDIWSMYGMHEISTE
ncbi:hypothetical protein FRB94_002436 [Tulasnella sp. JGI-2019a]|nr:hypothetical protein FRB94_002436 [Tulasnella sp. JGI-2019a]